MSDFLRNPQFQPDEEMKKFIEGLFAEAPKKPSKPKGKISPPAPESMPTLELSMDYDDDLPQFDMDLATKYAKEEMESIRVIYLEFQDKISDMAIYPYLYPGIQDLGEICRDMDSMIENTFDTEELSSMGEVDYKKMLKIRARILASVFNKYKGKK
jgi:hypothetical protein